MAAVDIVISGHNYQIICDEGQEAHLLSLASKLDNRVTSLASTLGKGSETLHLVMTALMMEDQLADPKSAENANIELAKREATNEANNTIVDAIDAMAEYIENIAIRIEKS